MTGPDYAAQKVAHRALVETTDHRVKALKQTDAATVDQFAAIRQAFAVGIAPAEIVRVTGLSRTRIYEIRDQRRDVSTPAPHGIYLRPQTK